MSSGIPINIATAVMEEINTLVYDHVGKTYHLTEV